MSLTGNATAAKTLLGRINRYMVENAVWKESAEGGLYRAVSGDTFGITEEWMNPPMEVNKVYRTMERHHGKPVYAVALELFKYDYGCVEKMVMPLPSDFDWSKATWVVDISAVADESPSADIKPSDIYMIPDISTTGEQDSYYIFCGAPYIGMVWSDDLGRRVWDNVSIDGLSENYSVSIHVQVTLKFTY